MLYEDELIRKAFILYQEVMSKGDLKKKEDPEIYGYYFDIEIREIIERIFLDESKTKILYIEDTLYFVPELENETYSYTNEELRKEMGLKTNRELYLVQFIWMNLISEFYDDQYQRTNRTRSFVKIDELIHKVKEYMERFEKIPEDELYQLSSEYSLNLSGMLKSWNSLEELTDKNANVPRSKNKIYGFFLQALGFWKKEKLIDIKEDQEVSLTYKAKDIIGAYYHNEKRILDIKELLEERIQTEGVAYAESK